jgi:hypothetical protein
LVGPRYNGEAFGEFGGLRSLAAVAGRELAPFHGADGADALQGIGQQRPSGLGNGDRWTGPWPKCGLPGGSPLYRCLALKTRSVGRSSAEPPRTHQDDVDAQSRKEVDSFAIDSAF